MRLNHALLRLSVACLGTSAAAGFAHAAAGDQIGSALLVENRVTADFARETRTLATGDGVRQEELIEVALDARSELVLGDETRLALGPGARLKLDRFVYDPEKSGGSIAVSLTRGTLRWVTGVAKKPAYVIRVPNASITVRGTIFDVHVTESGATWVLLHEGGIQVCNDRGECRVHADPCKIIHVSEGGDVGHPARFADFPGQSEDKLATSFPFVVTPPASAADAGKTCSAEAILSETAAAPRPAPPRSTPPAITPLRRTDKPKPVIVKPLFVPERNRVEVIPAPLERRKPAFEKPAGKFIPSPERRTRVELPRVTPRPRDRYVEVDPPYVEPPRAKPRPRDPYVEKPPRVEIPRERPRPVDPPPYADRFKDRWKERLERNKERYEERQSRHAERTQEQQSRRAERTQDHYERQNRHAERYQERQSRHAERSQERNQERQSRYAERQMKRSGRYQQNSSGGDDVD